MTCSYIQFLASLSDEEKTLLTAEGVVLPVGRAITKAEERELKQLRRKIKNKLSAQDSRRRRKEHMSTLEVENQDLRSQIQQLKNENKSLSSHLGAIQDSVGRRIPRGSRCVVMMMLLALSSQALPCAAASHELEAALPAGTSMMGNFSSATPTVPDYTVLSAAQSSLVADVLSKAGVTTKLPSMEGVECVVLRGNPERDVAWDVSMPPLIPLSELATGSH